MSPSFRSDLAVRLGTSAVWVPGIIYLLFWGPPWGFPLLAAGACVFGAWELFGMVGPQHHLLRAWGMFASLCVFTWITPLGPLALAPSLLPMAIVLLTCGGMMIALTQPLPLEQAGARMGWAIAGPLYLGGLFGAMAALFGRSYGGSWVMLALMCGFFSDTGGYFAGRKFGRRKLYPVVSPKKTIEGTIGGLAGGLLGGLLAHFWYLQELALLPAIVLSLTAAALGQVGDLCESLLKRSVGVKDSGAVLPGHGGILDRSDAVLFSAATIWVYVALFKV